MYLRNHVAGLLVPRTDRRADVLLIVLGEGRAETVLASHVKKGGDKVPALGARGQELRGGLGRKGHVVSGQEHSASKHNGDKGFTSHDRCATRPWEKEINFKSNENEK